MEQFSFDQKATVVRYLPRVESYKNAMTWGQFIVDISRACAINPIAALEVILRERESNTFMIGIDIALNPQFDSIIPHQPEKYLPYYLWTCVNGAAEAKSKLDQLHITPEENISRLPNTGLLVAKSGSDSARMLSAKQN